MDVKSPLIICATLLMLGAGCHTASDDELPCPEGIKAGAQVPCSCKSGPIKTGTQTCQKNLTLGACQCGMAANPAANGDGGEPMTTTNGVEGGGGSGATAGTGGHKGGGKDSSSSGGHRDGGTSPSSSDGGGTSAPDGGTIMGNDGGGTVTPLPDDGNQLAVCETNIDCNKGLDCYDPGDQSKGSCSKVCSTDDDCKGLAGGAYTCLTALGVCAIECAGTDDARCPAQMTCQNTGLFGGLPQVGGASDAGETNPNFHCAYPNGAGVQKHPAWDRCTSGDSLDCDKELVCNGINSTMSGIGYCTQGCVTNDDCKAMPSSGAITPTCVPVVGFGGPRAPVDLRCALDCTTNTDGCPTGMTCTPVVGVGQGPMGTPTLTGSRCEYAN